MYIINDGKSLELSLDFSSAFLPPEFREESLEKIRTSNLPLEINLSQSRVAAPAALSFLQEAIETARREHGRVRIFKKAS